MDCISKIAGLSSGKFVGMVADDPDCKIDLKTFHCKIFNDHQQLSKEQSSYLPIPSVRTVANAMSHLQIKQEIEGLVNAKMERILSNPALEGSILKKQSR